MLTVNGKISAVVALAGAAVISSVESAHAETSSRPCTSQEGQAFCEMASASGYYDGGLWWCPVSVVCLWDDEHNEPAGSVTYQSQSNPCDGVMLCG